MAFTYVRERTWADGCGRRSTGTFTNGSGDSGGVIVTGLKYVSFFSLSNSSHIGAETAKITRNSPNPGDVSIVTSNDVDGYWTAEGRL